MLPRSTRTQKFLLLHRLGLLRINENFQQIQPRLVWLLIDTKEELAFHLVKFGEGDLQDFGAGLVHVGFAVKS